MRAPNLVTPRTTQVGQCLMLTLYVDPSYDRCTMTQSQDLWFHGPLDYGSSEPDRLGGYLQETTTWDP